MLSAQSGVSDRRLVIGADGLVGGALRTYWRHARRAVTGTSLLPVAGDPEVVPLDLAGGGPACWPTLPPARAAVLCAAITSLEACRRDPVGTREINVVRTLALARRLAEEGCFVVFISSNLVFDGTRPRRHPDDAACPQTEYGRHKAEAEAGLASLGDRVAIVRLTKVWHPGLALLRGWRERLERGEPIQPFTDLACAPISLETVVRVLAQVADEARSGIWQLSAAADVSYAAIAGRLAERLGCAAALVRPVAAASTGRLEHCPAHTTLEAARAASLLGVPVPEPWTVIDPTLAYVPEPR